MVLYGFIQYLLNTFKAHKIKGWFEFSIFNADFLKSYS
jgi:hypothetical protein